MKKLQFVILFLLVSFGSVGAVLFTPALPTIQTFFQVSVGEAQLTVSSYLIGFAFGQLPYGPIANRFGRKKALYIGISLAILGSLLCAISSPLGSFGMLIFARIIQALGSCVGTKICFTMIADAYDQVEATKMISRLLTSFAVMPSIAVAIGGWLTEHYGWESCFYFLALFGVFILLLSSRITETAKSIDRSALKFSSIFQGYWVKLKNERLLLSGLMMGCGTAVIYVFASKAPFIGIKLMGLSPEQFGIYNLIPLTGMFLGALLALRLAGRFHVSTLLLSGIISSLIVTLTMLIPFAMGIMTPLSLFLPMVLIYTTENIIFANASSFGLSSAKNKSNASAVMNFINTSITVIAVLLAGWIFPESSLLMPISFVFFFFLMVLLWLRLRVLISRTE